MPVHFAGLPVDLDPIYELARERGLRVIEDAAHAIGAEYKGRRIGSFGDIQVFSFHPNKNITTGEGGCVATADLDLASRIRALRFHGIEYATQADPYDVCAPGFKYNMMDLQAAIGLHQLPRLDGFVRRRTALAQRYLAGLGGGGELWSLPEAAGFEHVHAWHLFTLLLPRSEDPHARRNFIEQMRKREIAVGIHYAPVHLFRYYRERFDHKPGDFPIAEDLGSRIVSLPLFPSMRESDIDRVVEAVWSVFE